MPDLNLLIAFDVLLEEGSAASAARRLNVSAPAMSRILARIREAFGDPILVRSGRGLTPTPRALELHEQVRAVVEQAHAVFTTGRQIDLFRLERTFNLRANDVFIGAFSSKLRELMDRYAPLTVLRFVSESDVDDRALEEGRIDLHINAGRNFSADTKVQHLFRTGFVGLVRNGHPILDLPVDASRFASYEHISVSRRGRATGPIDDMLGAMGLARRVSLVTPNFHSAIFALADSDMVLPLMPTSMMDSVRRLGLNVSTFDLPLVLEPVDIVQAWHPRLDNDSAHRWLRRMLKQACNEMTQG
jgi:DNA-binding transcriptional LysR family regulator